MDIVKGVELNYLDGKIVLTAEVKSVLAPVIDGLISKVESGEIDPIKGTDLDKMAILKALELIKGVL